MNDTILGIIIAIVIFLVILFLLSFRYSSRIKVERDWVTEEIPFFSAFAIPLIGLAILMVILIVALFTFDNWFGQSINPVIKSFILTAIVILIIVSALLSYFFYSSAQINVDVSQINQGDNSLIRFSNPYVNVKVPVGPNR